MMGMGARPGGRGLGSSVKRVTRAIGIKPCLGCNRRATVLNKIIPSRQRGK